jgi:tRNA(Ile)-lysidine synthase
MRRDMRGDVQLEHVFEAAMCDAGGFESAPHIAVAVSGGCDSMALCLLAKQWVDARGGQITALIVDHRLRAESTQEAQRVAGLLAAHQIASVVLTIAEDIGCTSIQEKARILRYQYILQWCVEYGVLHVLTGHHGGDQRETVVMRMIHGAGLKGLCAIAAVVYRDDVRVLRPLLRACKDDCITYLYARGQQWCEDASNTKPMYQRNRVRMRMGILEDEGWSVERSIKLVDNLQRSEAFIRSCMVDWLAKYAMIHPAGFITLSLKHYAEADIELRFRIVSYCLTKVYGDLSDVRMTGICALDHAICATAETMKRTLNGCLVLVDNFADNIIFCREIARVDLPLNLSDLGGGAWDKRFRVHCNQRYDQPLYISVLGKHGVSALRRMPFVMPALPVEVLRIFPALWGGGALDCLVAVPHMGYYGDEKVAKHVKIVWTPITALAD